MKKLFTFIMALFVGTMLFAATGTYVVESVTGNVTYESAPGKFDKVKVGQELSASTVLNTGLNSSVVVNFDGTDCILSNLTITSETKTLKDGDLPKIKEAETQNVGLFGVVSTQTAVYSGRH